MANSETRSGMIGGAGDTVNVVSADDREILRRLAGEMAALAARPIEQEKRTLWTAHNELEETRPLIFCDPEHGWLEIITDDILTCRGELARQWERRLRKEIYWATTLQDDRVIEPCFDVPHVYTETDWGMKETKIGGEHGGSFIWEAPMKDWADFEKLHFPVITVDHEATKQRLELARSVLGDLLEVRLRTGWWWTLGLTRMAANLRGLEQLMLDMYDSPDELKRLMAFLRDGTLARVEFLEKNGLLASNLEGSYVGSGGFGFNRGVKPGKPSATHGAGLYEGARTSEMWGFCESQETVGIGPDMFEEFVFPFQVPLLEKFALNCYGCCEPLHLRWKVIEKAPRLRRISVSPWADVKQMAEQLSNKFIYSYKATPSDLALPTIDEDLVRSRLRKLRDATRGCRLEVIMKDNHTLGGSGRNAIRWVQIAREELAR